MKNRKCQVIIKELFIRCRKLNISLVIMANRKFQAIIKGLFIKCRKLNISLVFITQSYFSVPKDVRLNSTHYLVMKISNKRELKKYYN